MASNGLYSAAGTCLSAAAWTTMSTPSMARYSRSLSRTSPMKKRSAVVPAAQCLRISYCFSSSRE